MQWDPTRSDGIQRNPMKFNAVYRNVNRRFTKQTVHQAVSKCDFSSEFKLKLDYQIEFTFNLSGGTLFAS